MKRKWAVYFWNIVLYTMIITFVTPFSFTLNTGPFLGERMNVIVTLVLTAVAMQYNVQKMLPKLPYVTLMDQYLLFSFFYISIILLEATLSGQYAPHLADGMWETYVGWAFSALWFLYHFIFLVKAGWVSNQEASKLVMSSDQVPEALAAEFNFMSRWWFEDIYWVGEGQRICAYVAVNPQTEHFLKQAVSFTFCEFLSRECRKARCVRCCCSSCCPGAPDESIHRRMIRSQRAVSTVDQERRKYFQRTSTGGFGFEDRVKLEDQELLAATATGDATGGATELKTDEK